MRTTLQRLFLVALAAAPVVGCQRGEEPPQRIFLVTVDTLRADHLGSYGYGRDTSPAIDQLAAEGVRFDRAIAQWPLTGPSFASLMSGLYPRATGLLSKPHVAPPEGVTLLPEFLQEQGYRTVAVVSNRVLSREVGWGRGFDEYLETWSAAGKLPEDPAMLKTWLAAPRVNELALPLLERHHDAKRLFVWLHYSDPHTPYTLPPDFDNPFVGDDPTPAPARLTKSIKLQGLETVGEYVANYDANILLADRGVSQALDRARDLGLLEDAVVIFTSDHGESLGEHGYFFRHGRFVYNATAHVPLLIHGPGRFASGGSVEQPVELVDIYPTLRELVAPGEAMPGLSGKSLMRVLRGEAQPVGFAVVESGAGKRLRAAQTRDWKLIVWSNQGPAANPPLIDQLYQLNEDPHETRNLIETHPEVALELRTRLDQWLSQVTETAEAESLEIDEEMRRSLEALGYLD